MRSPKRTVQQARGLRGSMSRSEVPLWVRLRGREPGKPTFRRQHPIGPYVVDFYCRSAGLVVEVDGMSHDDKAAQDAERSKYLEAQGLRILRVLNRDVMDDLDAVSRETARLGGVPWD